MITKAIIQLCGSSNILVVQPEGNPRNLGGQGGNSIGSNRSCGYFSRVLSNNFLNSNKISRTKRSVTIFKRFSIFEVVFWSLRSRTPSPATNYGMWNLIFCHTENKHIQENERRVATTSVDPYILPIRMMPYKKIVCFLASWLCNTLPLADKKDEFSTVAI